MGVVSYSHMVRLFEAGCAYALSSEVVPGSKSPSEGALLDLKQHELAAPYPGGEFFIPAHVLLARNALHGIVSAHTASSHYHPSGRRCLGTAVEYAVQLIALHQRIAQSKTEAAPGAAAAAGTQPSRLDARVVVLAAGGCNYGPGAVPDAWEAVSTQERTDAHAAAKAYFRRIGDAAVRASIGIDVFCIGHELFSARTLAALTAASGGQVHMLETAGAVFKSGLRATLGLWKWDAATGRGRSSGNGGRGWDHDALVGVQLRTAAPLELTQLVGPVLAPGKAPQCSRGTLVLGDSIPGDDWVVQREGTSLCVACAVQRCPHEAVLMLASSLCVCVCRYRVVLPRASHPNLGLAAALTLCDDTQRPTLPIQVVFSSRGVDGRLRTRVETTLLRTGASKLEVMASVEPVSAAVLVAKQACLAAQAEGVCAPWRC